MKPQSPLRVLAALGQSVWLDYVRRGFIESGELHSLVDEGVTGLTSNPTIFEQAIAETSDYDRVIERELARDPDQSPETLYEALALEDIRKAADVLHPVYEATGGTDGFACLEVSPRLARDTSGTILEARRLHDTVDRPNVMVKVPATPEGIPAIELLVAEGVPVNVTLMFSQAHHEAVSQAYLRGLQQSAHPERAASVASLFVSRVDAAVDEALEEIGTPQTLDLRGRVAIANARVVYEQFRNAFHGESFRALRERGGRVQRCLWASTSTKNPEYRDVRYVEELVGQETVSTMPLDTLRAFRDHGRVRGNTLKENEGAARETLSALEEVGVDLGEITQRLQQEGVNKFAASYESLLMALECKRHVLAHGSPGR